MTDDRVRTRVRTSDGWLDFQDYFVRRRHRDRVLDLDFDGLDQASPTGDVLGAIQGADVLVIAPSNPFVSVAPILSLRGVLDSARATPATVVAVSPIVGGAALRGPAAEMIRSLGGEATVRGVAAHYAERYPGLIDVIAVDREDASHAPALLELGIEPLLTDIVIPDQGARQQLANELLLKFAR
jgi:LPPG:FO 2-phospho-L-lactate transferase